MQATNNEAAAGAANEKLSVGQKALYAVYGLVFGIIVGAIAIFTHIIVLSIAAGLVSIVPLFFLRTKWRKIFYLVGLVIGLVLPVVFMIAFIRL